MKNNWSWLDEDEPKDNAEGVARRTIPMVLVRQFRLNGKLSPVPPDQATGNPWDALAGLVLLAEDKTFINGYLSALQLPEQYAYSLLAEYARRWRQASDETEHHNRRANQGRRAANVWLLSGAAGLVTWTEVARKE